MTGMLQVLSVNVNALLDQGATLSLVHIWLLGSFMYNPMFLLNHCRSVPQWVTL